MVNMVNIINIILILSSISYDITILESFLDCSLGHVDLI